MAEVCGAPHGHSLHSFVHAGWLEHVVAVWHQKIALVMWKLREVSSSGTVRLDVIRRSSVAGRASFEYSISRCFAFTHKYVPVSEAA